MNIQQAKEIVFIAVNEALEIKVEVTEDSRLVGHNSLLDSMKLVEVCLTLEDLADDNGFVTHFAWGIHLSSAALTC